MKTTLDLPDELMRAVKIRAAKESRKLKDMMADLLTRGLSQDPGTRRLSHQRVRLPLVHCAHDASPQQEVTPERAATILLQEEAASSSGFRGPVR